MQKGNHLVLGIYSFLQNCLLALHANKNNEIHKFWTICFLNCGRPIFCLLHLYNKLSSVQWFWTHYSYLICKNILISVRMSRLRTWQGVPSNWMHPAMIYNFFCDFQAISSALKNNARNRSSLAEVIIFYKPLHLNKEYMDFYSL